jgi:Acetyltransferase (GNAT) domain
MTSQDAIRIRPASEADLPRWQDFADLTPGAGGLHHAGWYCVLRDAYWVTPLFLMGISGDDTIVGILPTYVSRSLFTGLHISSLEGGVLARRHEAATALLAEAIALRDRMRSRYLQLRGGAMPDASGIVVPTVRTIIPTDGTLDALWAGMKQSCRRAVRKGEKEPVVVEQDPRLDRMEEFYTIYAAHMHRLGTPVMGIDAFAAMRAHLGRNRLRLYLVRKQGHVIGGMLCLANNRLWTSYLTAVAPSKGAEFANYTLYWHVIRDAFSMGVARLDLGRSTAGSNVHVFKQRWGGIDVEVPYRFYPAPNLRSGDMGLQNLKKEKGLPQRVWSRLPLTLCNRLGPLLRKQLPFI